MNTSENKKKIHEDVDQFDDLTRFLDEDFDTDDVDLFEFTTEQDSPLADLKSIVLSLDWEITDSTMQDLADELERLKEDDNFRGDKISQVYLQGLSKIGQYIRSELAHSHPNAIKLLLTFYYDFEKILSSDTITGTEITALLKADVRKFKILQYQIAKRHGDNAPMPAVEEAKKMGLIFTDSEALRGIRATILELDWEITDESLARLTEKLDKLKSQFAEDRFIQVLLQGLYSLKSYIAEEKSRAHPESYTLLHTFSEAIARLIENGGLDEDQRQEILIEQVNSLNNLKALVAGTPADIEPYVEEEAGETEFPGGGDLDVTPALAGETEESEIREEAAPDELTAKLESFFGPGEDAPEPGTAADEEDLAAALSDAAEETEISDAATPPELEENLESFFGEEEKAAAPDFEEAALPDKEIDAETAPEEEDFFGEDSDIEPALAGDESEGSEIVEEIPSDELTERLEFFFGTEEEVASFAETELPEAGESEGMSRVAAEEESMEAEEEIVPALSGSPEESGFGFEQELEPPEGLAEKLEDFFAEKKAPEEEEILLTSALTEETDAAPEAGARPVKNEEEYQAAVVQIRTHFKKLESSLRQEIATLQEEVENLRSQLNSN
ncbi:MAG: hypothetical protein SCH71_12460 [Desulfobulbaceae bacterium]|nr:hypothetical protein [Desulfobulbaceae bacterium]